MYYREEIYNNDLGRQSFIVIRDSENPPNSGNGLVWIGSYLPDYEKLAEEICKKLNGTE